MDITLQAT